MDTTPKFLRRAARAVGGAAALSAAAALAACGGDSGPPGPTQNVRSVDVTLSDGEARTEVVGGDILELNVPSSEDGAEYRLAVNSATRSSGVTPVRLKVETGSGGSSSASAGVPPVSGSRRAGPGWRILEPRPEQRAMLLRQRLRTEAVEMLRRRNVRPARPGASGSGGGDGVRPSVSAATAPAAVGDKMTLRFPVWDDGDGNFRVTCSTDSAPEIRAEVKAVGDRVLMVEDTVVETRWPTSSVRMDYAGLADEFDQTVFGTNVAYFGSPTDIDGNGHVIVLFSPRVNDLTPRDSDTRIGGFFVPADLADNGDGSGSGTTVGGVCEAGNEAELLYLLAPDPDGDFSDPVFADTARTTARSTSGHEFEHLLNTANRVIKAGGTFGDVEATWLDEGLAHLAEEVVGLTATSDPLRSNLELADVTETQEETDAFNAFHLGNFADLRFFFLNPSGTQTLATSDPGQTESLEMRGWGWIFLRWLADQEYAATPGAVPATDPQGETQLFRDLAKADGGDLTAGIENVEAATGRGWKELMADFSAMPAADDDVPGLPQRHRELTWDLRDVFRALHENDSSGEFFTEVYPLQPTQSGFAAQTIDFDLRSSATKYVTLVGSGSVPAVTVRLTNQVGDPVGTSAEAQVTVVRVQ